MTYRSGTRPSPTFQLGGSKVTYAAKHGAGDMQAGNEANTPDTGNTYSPVTVSLGCPFLVTTPYKLIYGHMQIVRQLLCKIACHDDHSHLQFC